MNWLAVETSTVTGSLTFFSDKKIIASRQWTRMGSHSELLTLAAQELSHENNIALNSLKRLAIGIGPGSFTGIRAGINFVRALGYSLNIPVYNLNSLALLAHQPNLPQKILVRVIQYAFRDLVYTAEYTLDQGRVREISPPCALTISELEHKINKPCLVLGTGFEMLKPQLSSRVLQFMQRENQFRDLPLSDDFLHTSVLDERPAQLTDWIHTIPLYIRASEAEEKLKAGALKPL